MIDKDRRIVAGTGCFQRDKRDGPEIGNRPADDIDSSNTINLAAGTYDLASSAVGELLIQNQAAGIASKSLMLVGKAKASTIIQSAGFASASSRLFEIVSAGGAGLTVNLENLTLRNGFTRNGGSLGETTALGGGLLIEGGSVALSNVEVADNIAYGTSSDNIASVGGNAERLGIYVASGTVSIVNSSIVGNIAYGGNGNRGISGTIGGGHGSHGSSGQAGVAVTAGAVGSDGVAAPGALAGTVRPVKLVEPGGRAPDNGKGDMGGAGGNASGGGLYVAGGTLDHREHDF